MQEIVNTKAVFACFCWGLWRAFIYTYNMYSIYIYIYIHKHVYKYRHKYIYVYIYISSYIGFVKCGISQRCNLSEKDDIC